MTTTVDALVRLVKECKVDVSARGRTVGVGLCYPRCDGNPNAVEIDLMDVRAADGVRVSYDFDRDGWVIQQATKFQWEVGEEPDPGWKEVAFVQAWASKVPEAADALRG